MMKDLTGQYFGKLIAIKPVGKGSTGNYLWLCKCKCGNNKIVAGGNLVSKNTASCGCGQRGNHIVHNASKTRFYNIFCKMEVRCNKPKDPAFKWYGNRGIKCLWNSFEAFKNDMYESYLEHVKNFGEKDTTIDRIDNNGNYCKENCRWATRKEQANNQNKTRHIKYRGRIYSLNELEEKTGIKHATLSYRIFIAKWSLRKAMILPLQKNQFG